MPITLTELVKDFSDAAVAMDQVCRASSMVSLIGECDHDEDNGYHMPSTEKIKLPDGREVEVPTAALKHHSGLQADKLTLSLTTDAILEGRTLSFKAPQEFYPIKGSEGEEGEGNRRVGFYITGSIQLGSLLTDDGLIAREISHDLLGFLYYPTSGTVMLKCQAHTNFDLFAGIELTVCSLDGEHRTILELDRAKRSTATVGGFVIWNVQPGDFDWLLDIPDGERFKLSFVDEGHNREVERVLGIHSHKRDGTYFDVMVTFTDGLGETSSKLTLNAEFSRQPSPEGVALVNDRLNKEIRTKLD